MILPDLQKELAFWADRLKLGNWKIAIRYEADPRDPATGAPVYGYCVRQTDIPSAEIVVRTPTTDADIAETHDTIVHELLHCRLAALEGPRMAEENAVWTLAPLLTELRLNAPTKAAVLCKALARGRTLLAAQTGARAGEGYDMDPQQLAELAMQAGQLITQEGLSEEVKNLLTQLIALAAGGSADMPTEGESLPPKEGDKPEEPAMGLQKEDEKPPTKAVAKVDGAAALLKQIQEQMMTDRAAAVDGLLDTRPDLTAKQRERLRELGLAQGVAMVRQDLADLLPPPKTEAKVETRAKLGEEKPIRGSNAAAKAMPSGNAKVDQLFRLINKDPTSDGVEIPADNTGKLVQFSIVQAFAKIKHNAEQAREAQRVKMGGTK